MSELLRHRQLRAQVRFEDMPVRRVRALSTPTRPVSAEVAAAPAPAAPHQPAPAQRPAHVAYSAHVGRFFRAKQLMTLPVAVRKGQRLGVVKALGLEFPVDAPCAGWVDSVDVECGVAVEYGQPVVALRLEG